MSNIICRKNDGLVLFVGNWELTPDCATNGKLNCSIVTTANAVLYKNVDIPKGLKGGCYTYANGNFILQDASYLQEVKEKKLEELANYRWEKETGGVTINGVVVATDDRSKTMLNGAKAYLAGNNEQTIKWKKSDGTFLELDKTAVDAISDAVAAHVQTCFAKEALLTAAINALTAVEDVLDYSIINNWEL